MLNGIYQFLAAFDEVAVASQVIQKLDFYSSAIYKVSFSEHKTYIIKISSPKLLDRAFNTHMISKNKFCLIKRFHIGENE